MIAALRTAFTRAAALAAGLVLLLAATDAVAQRAFTTRFTTNANGDVRMIGNANMTCPIAAANCAAARAGGNFSDNDFTMEDIDVDLDATTFNSSTADLSVPAGSTVLFAGLYWGANSGAAARNQVLLQRPGGFGYVTVSASQVDTTGSTQYGAFADVTSMVAAGGSGTYAVANIQRTLGANQWAGWSLIVVYGDNAATLKNLTVFDGFQIDPVTTTVSGFLTPLSGPITTRLGFVGYDGDRDSTSAGEAFTINGVAIVDGQNPALNFYNSTISNLGSPFTARNPNYNNTLGLDIDLVTSPAGALGNGATSATITLQDAAEQIWIHAVVFATDIYVPIITPNVIKTATDVNGGGLNRGDVLRFNISLSNTGQDTGTNVVLTDNIPANTTYVPGSLVITSGANAGAKSDTPGNDQAEFATGPNRVIFRLGTGANAVSGGNLANGQSTAIQFDVTIDAATPAGAQISNTASISYSGQTLGASFGTTSAAANATVLGPPTIAKSFSPAAIANGGTSVLTIVVANPAANPANLTAVTFTDTYPANLVNTGAPSPNITCTAGSAVGTVTAAPGGNSLALSPGATIAPGGSCTVTVNVTSTTDGAYNNVTGAVASTNGGTGATANATLSVGKPSIAKSIAPATILSGGTATVTLTLQNPTAIALTNVAFTDTLVGMTVAATPAITNTCGGTFTAPALGTATSLATGALGAGASCTITFAVTSTTTGVQSNTASGVTSTQTAPAGNPSNTATLTVIGAPVITKSFNPTSTNVNVPSQMTITVSNPNPTTTITGFAFTDTYPDPDGGGAAAQMRNDTPANRTLNCTAGSTATATGGLDNGVTVGMSAGSLAPNGSCTITVNVESSAIVGASMAYVNSTGTVTTTNAGTGAAASATLTVGTLTPPTVTKGFAPANVAPGATSVMTITLTNGNASAVTGVAFTDTYPAGLVNTGTPAGATTCPAGAVTALAGGSSVAFSGGTINAASSCTITVNVTSPTAGSRFNSTGNITTANAGTRTPGATATLNVLTPPSIVKSYNPTSVALNGDTTLTFVLTNLNNVALTGVGFTDVFPVGTSTRNAPAETNTCGGTWQDSGGGGIGNGDPGVRLNNNGTIPANGTCTLTVTVRGTAVGTYNNTSGAVTATGPIALTGNTASATLAVGQIGITKAFGTSPIAVNANSLLTFTISNSTGAARTGLAFTDTYPAGLVNATPLTTGGTCTGLTTTAAAGGGTFNVTAANVAAGGCTITVQVTSATPGTYLNQTSGATYTGDPTPGSPSNTASLVVRQVPFATKAFLPTTVTPGQASTLTITIANANGDTMTGVAYTDTFPAGMVVAATPNATNTCGGTFTDTTLGAIGAGDTGVRLAAGSIPANTTCTMTVDVSSAAAGSYVNTTGAIASTNAGNGVAATATLVVAAAPTVAKSFAPATIGIGGTSTLTITLTNPNATVAVTGAAFTDTYPAGMANAGTPNPSSSCGGTPTATAGGNTLALIGGTIPAGGNCAVTVSVTATASGALLNSTGAVTTTNAGTGASANGTLTVLNVLTVAKSFTPTNVGLGQTSVLTITLTNPNTTAVTGAAFSDTYPAGMVNTAAAGGATTCGGSPTLTALDNGTDVSISGATVPASGSCNVTVNVTSNAAGSYANTTDVVTTANAGTAAAANATLTVRTATLAKAFGAASINDAAATTLVYTLTNGTGNPAQSGIGFVDTLRTGLAINSATPGLTYSAGCSGPPNAAYVAGTRVLTLTGLAMANTTASCTVTVAGVTNAAQQLNAACPAVNFTNGAADLSGLTRVDTTGMADVCLVVNAVPPTVAKTFGAAAIADGAATTLVFTLTNTGTNPAQSGIALGDTLPASLRLNSVTPAVAYSAGCSGPAAAAYNAGTRALSGLTGIAMTAGTASCTVTVAGLTNLATAVNASCAGNPAAFTNLSANVTTTNATVTAGDVCLVVNALAPTLNKVFAPTTIAAGGTSTLTFTIANTGTNPARAGIDFTDNLPGNVRVAATPNVQTNCPAGAGFAAPGGGFTVAAAAGAATVVATNAQLTAGVASCQVLVDVTSAIGGAYTNNAASITGTANIDATGVTPSTLTVNAVAPTVAKAFGTSPIASGGTSTLTITLTNANTSVATLAAALTDTLPAGLSIAGTPNASTTCTGAGAVTTGGNSVTLPAGRSIPAAVGVTPGTCTFQVDVTGTLGGTYTNTIAAGALQTSNGNNAAAANANLVINDVAPSITKVFGAAAIASGGSTSLTLTLTNPNATLSTLTAALVDALPANLTTVAASIATTCGGTAPTQAAGNVTLPIGLTIPAGTGVTSGACTVSVNVTSVVAGTYTNTIAIGALQTDRGNNAAATSANLNVFAPPTVTKAFNLATIGQGQTSTMTIVVSSPAANPGNLTGVAVNDAYIGTLTNAAAGGLACTGAGTATLTGGANGGTSVGFNAGTIVPGGSCTITQLVTATSTNVNTTTAPTATGPVALTGTAANATLTIVTPTVAKTFGTGTINDGATTTLVFTLTNGGTNPAHSGIDLGDTLPTGLRLNSATPAVAYSAGCSGPAAAAYNAGTRVLSGLTGIAITAGTASCTVTVSGLTNAVGQVNASCPAANFTNTQAAVTATNATTAGGDVCLVVNALAPTLNKVFAPTTIAAGGTSTLTFTITNTGTSPARAGINFTDNLPGAVRVAGTPNIQTNCPAGAGFAAPGGGFTVAAAAGAASIVATNAQVNNGVASCQVSVDVTSVIGGAYTNNAASITGTANIDATGVTPSSLTVNAVAPTVAKAFGTNPIASGGTSTLTITLTNANASAATLSAALTDTLPAGLSIAGTPNASTTCTGAGAVTTGANSVTLPAGRSIPAAVGVTPGTCTFQVDVTGTLGGTYTNTIAAGALQTSNGNNAAATNANLTITAVAPSIVKAFGATNIATGANTSLTLTLTNPNGAAATLTAALVDNLPANLNTVAASVATTCGGTAPTQAATSLTLPVGLSIPAGTGVTPGSCTVSVNVTSATPGTYVNTIAIGALQTSNGNNAAATSATLNVYAPPTVTKAFNLASIGRGQTSTMTIVVSSAAGNPGNLTGVTINDAYVGTLTNAAAGSVACTGAGTATLTGGVNGGTSVGFNAGVIVPGGSCTITQLVTATSTNVNTTTAPTATGPVALTGTAANATLTIVTPTVAKTFGAGTIADGASTTVVFTLTNAGSNPAHSGIVLTDIIPSSLRLPAAPAVAYSAGCSGPATAAYNSGTGLLNGLTGIAITAGTAACTVTVSGLTNAAGQVNASCVGNPAAFTNLAANVTATNATVGGGDACLVVTAGTPTLNKAFSPTTIAAGGTSTLTFTITNTGTNPARAGINFTDNLPGAVRVAATPNVQTNCPAAGAFAAPGGGFTVAAAAGAATVVATNAQLNNGVASCQVRVDVTSAIGGAYTNDAASIAGTANIDATGVTPSTLTVNAVAPTLAKAFGTSPIASGGISTLTITLTNANTTAATLTAALTDTLPAGLSIAGTPNASTTCTGAGAVTTGANSVTLPAGRSIPAAIGVTPGTCTFQVDVTGTLGGTYTNTIAAGALQTSNGNNAAAANANLTITGVAPSIVKTFGATNIATGGTTTLTLALSNPNATAATLTAALVDNLPANLTTVAATVAGTCGGTAPTQAATSLTLPVGLSIPAGTGVTPGTCNVTVTVTSAVAGTYVNTIAIGALQTNNGNNAAATSATLNAYAPPTVTKAFNLASIGRGQTSTMTIVVSNPAANPGNLTGVAVNDAYIGTLTNAAAGGVACTGAGTATLAGGVNGGTSVGFNTGTIPPGQSCTITQLVTATSTNVNTTTAPTATGPVALTGTAANATLTVVTPTVAKTFGAAAIADGASTTVVFTLTNSGTNPAHAGIALTDIIPSSLRLPAAPAVAYSAGCSGPATAAYNSGTGLLNGLTGIAITAGTAACTVTVSGLTNAAGQVNASCVGNPAAFTNLAANVTATNATVGGGDACLVVTAGTPTLNKAFSPTTIAVGGTSTLTFTIANTGTNPARSGINFTDNLPGAVRVAGTPSIQTNCPAGGAFGAPGGGFTVAAAAGAASIVATNAQVNNGVASCQVSVDVTSAIGGAYTNNAASITGTANIDATGVTPSTLTVNAVAPTVAKAFGTNPIASGGTSTLTITLTNANTSAATLTAALTDTLPAGLAIAGTPNASTTCTGAGAVTTGANSVTLPAGRSIPAAVGVTPGTCTFQVDVTGTLGGTYTNTIAAGALQTSNGNNAAAANANLTITAVAPSIVKAFGATNIATGASTSLTLTLTNANNTAATLSAALVDNLPANLNTVAASVATTCGGTAPTQTATSLTLPVGLSVPAGTGVTAGACTVTVNVTSATPGSYVNTIGAGALQTNNGNNAAPTSATLNVFAPPTATKSFNLASIGSGQTSTMTITVSAAAGNPGNLTGVSINDAYVGTLTNAAAGSVACTGAGTATLTGGVNGGTSVGFNAATIPPGQSCTITQLVTATSTNNNTTTAPAATGPIALTGTAASATLTVATPTVSKAFGAAAITDGLATTLVFTLTNTGANPAQGGIAIGDTLPTGLRLNSVTPAVAYSAGCSGPAAAAYNTGTRVLSGLTGIAMTAGTASCTITLSGLTNTAGQVNPSCPAANFTNLAANVTATNASVTGGDACLVVNRVDPVLTKAFTPATIDQGGTSTLVFTLANQGTNPAQAGINFTDNLPAGVTVAGTPNVQSNCPAGGALVNNPVFVTTGAASVTVTGAAMAAATASCEIRVNVTSSTTGAYTNTAANIAGAANVNTTGLTATLTVQSVPPLTKAFGTATVPVGGTSTLVFTINNTAAGSVNRAGISFTDTLPAGIAIANPPLPTTNGNCGAPAFTAANNTQPFTASGVSVNAGQTCTITLSIRGVTAGVATNGNANITAFTGVQNNVANQSITVVGAPTIAKAFAPASIAADGTSTITFSITNPNTATALTGAGFTDTLANMVIAAAGAAGGTCTGAAGNVFAAGNTNLAFTGLTLAANATCTVTVVVTSDILGTHPNQASGVSSVEGPAGAASNTANLTVTAAAPSITKGFAPATIAADGTSTITFTIANTNGSTLTAAGFTDTLTNMSIAAAGAAAGTCAGAGTNNFAAGATNLAFTGLTIPANGSCTVQVVVASDVPGTHNNQASGVSSAQAATGAASNVATLTVNAATPTIAKAFGPATIALGGTSTITFTITNTNGVALTAATFSDTLANMSIAAVGAAGGTCAGAGTNNFAAGATNLGFTGLTIPANGACEVTVVVTSATPGTHPNQATGVASTQSGAAGAASNTANLTVTALAPTISKSFAPATIASGGTSTLTVRIDNPNGAAITVTGVTDTYPAGVTRAATPAASTTCAGGVVSSTALSVTLTGGTVPATGFCTFQINVTAATQGSFVNTIPAGALTTNVGTNAAAASATLTVTPVANVGVIKVGPATVGSGGTITYTVSITNAGPDAANAATFADAVPAAVSGVTANCGGAAGGAVCGAVNVAGNNVTGTVTTLPAGASVQITIQGTAQGVGPITNTATVAGPGGVTDPDNVNNTSSVTTTILAPDLTLTKTHTGNFTVGVNGVYTLTVANGAGSLATTGTITVVDTLPAGLSFVSATGTGWACGAAGQVVTCTSGTAIAAGAMGNPITLTVGVASTAVPSVLNTATVSGGGEPAATANNNQASDNTIVVAAAVNTFAPDNAQTSAPGTTVSYAHTFNAGLAGSVVFSTTNIATPAVPGWTQQIYRDTNCNGTLDGAEGATPLAGAVAVNPGDQVCIVVRDNIPAAAPFNAQNVISVTATFNGTQVLTRTDTTTVGAAAGAGLTLAKTVRNITQGGVAGSTGTARPNDILEYTITYTNTSASAVTAVVVTDATPAFTQYQAAVCGTPLPANLTGCSVTTQPAVNGTGSVIWTLTGSLLSGGSGSVSFTVRVQP